MSFAVVTYREGAADRLGVLLTGPASPDGPLVPARSLVEPPELKRWDNMVELLGDWPEAVTVLAGLQPEAAPRVASGMLARPVSWPRKVLCAGVNYRRHIEEMGGEVPGPGWEPFFFLKPPTTAVTGPADPIVIRDAERARFDWEAELAVVIGIGGRDIPAGRALEHVAGYCVANDVTARGYHRRGSVPAEPFRFDWLAAKAPDTSLPLGPGITPAFLVPDPQDLRLRLWVNGILQQDESTADMICGVDELVAAASRLVTLEPGDVIATGTPAGVGAGRGRYLRHGDVVTVAIDGLGQISNRVIDAERSRQ
jgi:2-keto-4-pentenoate hydratase/2-oxohepta-3-ene-1,7-dioic acid hydratase in catechol pathway